MVSNNDSEGYKVADCPNLTTSRFYFLPFCSKTVTPQFKVIELAHSHRMAGLIGRGTGSGRAITGGRFTRDTLGPARNRCSPGRQLSFRSGTGRCNGDKIWTSMNSRPLLKSYG
jgi:hypothetical protein